MQDNSRFETRAIHAGQAPDPVNGALMTPVYFNSTYQQISPGEPRHGYEYSRTTNPTRTALEANLASLEGADWGLCFASGLAAINAVADRLVPGDHVIAGNDLYGGTYRIFSQVFARYDIEFTFVDITDKAAVAAAFKPNTRYVYLESPSNPLLSICDIQELSDLAHAHGALSIMDNTFATPYLQQPLAMGADIVLGSLTKYLGGHSDVVGGYLTGNDEKLREELAFYQNSVGGQLGPMDAFLVLRGTKTLAVRMDRHNENAFKIAQYLESQDIVEKVLYPGLKSHPQHAIAAKQMTRGFGGMVSFELAGGLESARVFSSSTKFFALAESLGGVESLVEVPPLMTHASIPAAERHAAGLSDGLVRLSVGIEHVDDLIADIEQALEKVRTTCSVKS
ncbi:MAG: cystathionine gamma-lyase [Planctomycetota bacterium]|jgi:cystathionine gamma-lyase